MSAQQNKEVDFSNYFKNQTKNKVATLGKSKPAVSSSPGGRRAIILVLIMLVLASALAYVLYQKSQNKIVTVPDGYRLVAPPNQPAHLEKIK